MLKFIYKVNTAYGTALLLPCSENCNKLLLLCLSEFKPFLLYIIFYFIIYVFLTFVHPVKMVQYQQSDMISRYLAFTFILVSFIASVSADRCSDNRTVIDVTGCQKEKKEFTVDYPGCEPATVCIYVCRGLCETATLVTNSTTPASKRFCSCCKPTRYRNHKPRRVNFICNGESKTKKVFLPNIRNCGCVLC